VNRIVNVEESVDPEIKKLKDRPNFDDVTMSAIAERWSTVITAEVWKIKQGVKEIVSAKVLFPVNNASLHGLSPESMFTLNEITQKVQTEMNTNNTLLLPMVVKDMSLKKNDMVSYVFQGKPYSGQVAWVEHKNSQDFVLLAPKLFDVYDITDADDGFMIKQGVYPKNVIIREGDRLWAIDNKYNL